MSATTYRHVVRQLNKSSLVPRASRNKVIYSAFRDLFQQKRGEKEAAAFDRDMQNVATFIKAQQNHKILLDRYNPLLNFTEEERLKATARRVGLDMPVTHKPEEESS